MRTHGLSKTAEHRTWERMLQRCYNDKHKAYGDYGGRGIKVCKKWRGRRGFSAFLAHVGPRPSPKHSIDRYPDKNGNYVRGNVRWATRTEQNRNTRKNVMLTFQGVTRCLSEWAEIVDIGKKTIADRLKRGWTVYEALNTAPIRTREYTRKGH
jgi:hypothetical protein